jgi:hypothetical protein
MENQDVDQLIDRFVSKVNGAVRQRIREEDLPVQLREGGARFGLYYSWNIQRFAHINWIEPLEERLPARLPPSYRSLVTRFIFPAFEVPPLILLGNTGHTLYNEMSYLIVRDKVLTKSLLSHGYVQFARRSSGDYDPVCFDFTRRDAAGECPVVQIDHELALRDGRPPSHDLAPSFGALIEDFLKQGEADAAEDLSRDRDDALPKVRSSDDLDDVNT